MKEITNRYIYCTTNLINNMEYVGRRTCHCAIEEDDYLGSGTAFLKALKLYGRQNFKKKILKVCKTEAELYKQEQKITQKLDVVRNRKYYNQVYGGAPRSEGFKYTEEEIEKMNYLEEMMSDEMIYGVKVKDRSAEHKRPQVILSYIETVEDKVIGHFMTITDDLYSNDKSKVFSKGNDHFTHRYMNENEDVVPWMHKEGYMLVDKDKWSNYYMCVHGFGDFNQAVSEINAKSKIYKERINSNKSKKNTNVTTVDKSGFASKTNTIQFADSNMNHIARLAKTSNDYRNFMELYRRFEDVGFTNVYHAVTGSGSITAADAEIIRSGKLKCSADDVKRATSVLTYELKFKNIVSEVGGRGDYFKIALAFCFNHPEIDNEFLLKRLRKNYGKMTKIKSIRDALLQIEKIYNYRRNPKVSIEHDYLRRNSAK